MFIHSVEIFLGICLKCHVHIIKHAHSCDHIDIRRRKKPWNTNTLYMTMCAVYSISPDKLKYTAHRCTFSNRHTPLAPKKKTLTQCAHQLLQRMIDRHFLIRSFTIALPWDCQRKGRRRRCTLLKMSSN